MKKRKKAARAISPFEHYTVMIALVISLITTFLLGMLLTETLWNGGLNYFSDKADEGRMIRAKRSLTQQYMRRLVFRGVQAAASNRGAKQQMTIIPSAVSMDSGGVPAESITTCVSGFNAGDLVIVPMPWMGSPELFSVISYQNYIGSTGSWCFTAPPAWAQLQLAPGEYDVNVLYYRSGNWTKTMRGPSGTLTVQ